LGMVGGTDPEFSRDLGKRGWLGMALQAPYGGGRSTVERLIVVEELLAVGSVGSVVLCGGCGEQRDVLVHPVFDRAWAPIASTAPSLWRRGDARGRRARRAPVRHDTTVGAGAMKCQAAVLREWAKTGNLRDRPRPAPRRRGPGAHGRCRRLPLRPPLRDGRLVSTPEMVELMPASGVPTPESFAVASKSHRAAIRPPPEFAVAPPQSTRAPLPYRRCTDEYGGIEYGGLPVNCAVFAIMLYCKAIRCWPTCR